VKQRFELVLHILVFWELFVLGKLITSDPYTSGVYQNLVGAYAGYIIMRVLREFDSRR
jgi:hypothetical protein